MALYDEHRYRAMSTPTEVHSHLFWFVHGDRACVPVESCSIALRYTSYYTIQYHPMLYDIAVHRPSLLVTRHGVALGGPIVCCFVHSFIHSFIRSSIHPSVQTLLQKSTQEFVTFLGHVKPSGGKDGGSHLQQVASILR